MANYSTKELSELHPTHRYAIEVVSGLRISCESEWLSCERHLKDLQREGTEGFPFVFDMTRADRVFDWFSRCCKHVKGVYSGQPIELIPAHKFDLGCTFGWVHKDTGRRRFRKAFNEVARGNAKSAVASGTALYGMCGDCYYPPYRPDLRIYEESPQVECCAVDKEQARIVWNDAKSMGVKSPDISKRLTIKRTYIEHSTRGGHMRPLSKDTKNKDGLSPVIAIIDEYHAHSTSLIHDVVYSAFGKRAQNLMWIITTAGQDAENNPCKVELDICRKILTGEIPAEDYYVMVRELDKDDDPHDPNNWLKANPMLHEKNEYASYLLEQIQSEHDLAYGSGDPAKIREFLTKRCNLWQVDSENKYMSGIMDKWKELGVSRQEFLELVKGLDTWVGLDMSKSTDLTADGNVFRLPDGRFAVCAHGYMPEERAQQHEHSDRVPYKQWAKDGWCTLTEGAVTDYRYMKTHIHDLEFDEGWNVREFCYDPYNSSHFIQDLIADGYDEEQMVEIRQGVQTLSEPTKFLRELVLRGKIVHDNSPLLTWCMSNAVESRDNNGNIKLSKKHKDDSQRIDLAAAIINAMVRAMINEDTEPVYKTGGEIFSV